MENQKRDEFEEVAPDTVPNSLSAAFIYVRAQVYRCLV